MIRLLESAGSTNELALNAAAKGAEAGSTWIADRQTAGRGRREVGGDRRQWYSPAGTNLYMSVLLRPPADARDVSGVTLAVGAGACAAIADVTGVTPWLKWPNDLWVGDRKLAGILTEGSTSNGRVEAVVVGIGVNVNMAADDFAPELGDIATSVLAESGEVCDRMTLALAVRTAILEAAESYFGGGWNAVAQDVSRWDGSDGRAVTFEVEGARVRGTARGIGAGGALRVEVDGEVREVNSGEVNFRLEG